MRLCILETLSNLSLGNSDGGNDLVEEDVVVLLTGHEGEVRLRTEDKAVSGTPKVEHAKLFSLRDPLPLGHRDLA